MATVVEIDGSLMKIRFPTQPPVDEWLFRGSPRLWEICTVSGSTVEAQKTPQRSRVSRNPTQRRRVEIVNQVSEQTTQWGSPPPLAGRLVWCIILCLFYNLSHIVCSNKFSFIHSVTNPPTPPPPLYGTGSPKNFLG